MDYVTTLVTCMSLVGISAVSSVGGNYLGCYSSNHSSVLDVRQIRTDLTVSLCARICDVDTYTLLGLQYGSYCYCGTDRSQHQAYNTVTDTRCDTLCSGGPTCGGKEAIAVYTNFTYFGCLNHTTDHDFHFMGSITKLSLRSCMERCQANPFIGLAEGNKCFCSFESPRDGNNSQFLDDYQCLEEGITCPGGETCGGYGYVAFWDHIKELKIKTQYSIPVEINLTAEATPSQDPAVVTSTVYIITAILFVVGVLIGGIAGIVLCRSTISRWYLTQIRPKPTIKYDNERRPNIDVRHSYLAEDPDEMNDVEYVVDSYHGTLCESMDYSLQETSNVTVGRETGPSQEDDSLDAYGLGLYDI
ncbi:sialate:O-sulfotransferase 2-like [Apostichopus japonicus]|uniref:sialate:O-sulfotransferase 2-like n=1 Tax=Stichopus japonicus TaxID=307972 RepID=UPI003AB32426